MKMNIICAVELREADGTPVDVITVGVKCSIDKCNDETLTEAIEAELQEVVSPLHAVVMERVGTAVVDLDISL